LRWKDRLLKSAKFEVSDSFHNCRDVLPVTIKYLHASPRQSNRTGWKSTKAMSYQSFRI